MHKFSFESADAASTEAFGAALAAPAAAPLNLWLVGDLGSGKTTFARGFIHALGYRGRVKSPTYTLLETYRAGGFDVLHFDLYRLNCPRDFEALGADYLGDPGICLVEWPGNAVGLPAPDLSLHFRFSGAGRAIRVETGSERGTVLLSAARRYGTRGD